MKRMLRRRFLSICSLATLSLGLTPRRLLSNSGSSTQRFTAERFHLDTDKATYAEVKLVSVGQGDQFRGFQPHNSTVQIQHSMDRGAFSIVDTTRPVEIVVRPEVKERWRALNQRDPIFRWSFQPVFLNSANQVTRQMDIAGSHLRPTWLRLTLPLYLYRGTEKVIPKMLARIHAPSLSKPIAIGLTWTGQPFSEQPRARMVARENLRLVGRHAFTDDEIIEIQRAVANTETIEFDFYDAQGQDSIESAEAHLPRNERPLFRIKVPIQTGGLNETLFASAQLIPLCIEDIRQGRGEPIEEPCYFTTAACHAVGLPDDCWELRTLRRFRDEILPGLPNGSADITRYYEEAPAALARLQQSPTAIRSLLKIYWLTILPCALLARLRANRLCHWLYRKQHDQLAQRFLG